VKARLSKTTQTTTTKKKRPSKWTRSIVDQTKRHASTFSAADASMPLGGNFDTFIFFRAAADSTAADWVSRVLLDFLKLRATSNRLFFCPLSLFPPYLIFFSL